MTEHLQNTFKFNCYQIECRHQKVCRHTLHGVWHDLQVYSQYSWTICPYVYKVT